MTISTASFEAITEAFHRSSGIRLTEAKRQLVIGRLQKLARERGMASLDDYVEEVVHGSDAQELTRVVDKLTTNETYFFREPGHFQFLNEQLNAGRYANRQAGRQELRIWSAASSSGEEAYSIAMLLADKLGLTGWQVVGSDLSTAMVQAARRALYPMDRTTHIPRDYLKRFCLRGEGAHEGQLLVRRELRERVEFRTGNLMHDADDLGTFDIVFLRNVLIYFDPASKAAIVERVCRHLRPGGYLFTGHAESLNNPREGLRMLRPAVYELRG
jgi:chemotaxis protein methyltransferase CheR